MAIDRSLRQLVEEIEVPTDLAPDDIEIEIVEGDTFADEGVSVAEMDDGSVVVDFEPDKGSSELQEVPHYENLADYLSEDTLISMAIQVMNLVDQDIASRKNWIEMLEKGVDNLGLKPEPRTKPWKGACDVVHPLLLESIVRFQAQTIGEIIPPKGPVKTSIVGTVTDDKVKQSKRVEAYMNYYITNRMTEYRPETEKLLFGLALNGSAFRKLYRDELRQRACSHYVPAEDLIVNYGAPDLITADRVTHRFKMSDNDVLKLMVSGFYRYVEDLPKPTYELSEMEEKVDSTTGFDPAGSDPDRRMLYEVHTNWDFGEHPDGIALPYVITIDNTSRKVFAVRRNWKEGDELREKLDHFVHYEFVPGLGFYGLGYAHIIGNTSSAATSILRQLVDAGTLSNLPGGLKTRNLRVKGDSTPVKPGEWRDVDVTSGKLSDNLFPMPYKEPSPVLAQLMGVMVEDARRLASMADLKVADMNQNAPVGTTLAIIERAMKMQTAIQQRIHDGLRREFKILARIVGEENPSYPYDVEEGREIKQSDFDERIDIIPVSDPNASTMAQKVMQYQAVTVLAQQSPAVFDLKFLNRQFIDMIGVPNSDKIVPMDGEVAPTDPVTENANILNLGKVQAYEHQDHDAHLRVHMALKNDPGLQQQLQNSPSGPGIAGAIDAHIREHLAFQYRRQVEEQLGVPLPPMGQPLPADVEKRISTAAADAADQLMQKKQAEAQALKNAEIQNDPIIQQKEKELQIRAEEVERKKLKDQFDAQFKQQQLQFEERIKNLEMQLKERIATEDREQRREKERLEAEAQVKAAESRDLSEGLRLGIEAAKSAAANNRAASKKSED